MSEQLKAFYKAYAAWLDEGAPDRDPFNRRKGLCYSLDHWPDYNFDLSEEMQQQFTDAGLCCEFPFDKGRYTYHKDTKKHLNPARVAWVRKHAEEESSR
ncbi:hypothetical protein W70_73 [Escherichia phage W70]|nr:hypothetical protein W70_73 [Escherichia phage W70]